jgi:nitrate/nitrite-specific signal transduction histidine kinase
MHILIKNYLDDENPQGLYFKNPVRVHSTNKAMLRKQGYTMEEAEQLSMKAYKIAEGMLEQRPNRKAKETEFYKALGKQVQSQAEYYAKHPTEGEF